MGTTWRVLYAARHSPDGVRTQVEARLAELVAALSHWEADSALCRFNRSAGEWVTLPRDLARVVDAGLHLAKLSGGAFDPAIGALVDLWGFGPPGPMPDPDDAVVEAARTRSGWQRLDWDRDARRLRQPGGLQLDLSGIAKGYAADELADLLAGTGIAHCLVEVGGELVGRGIRPDGEPWWVDLEPPTGSLAPAPLRIALHGLGVATSGTYVRGAHSIDPRTGHAPGNGVVSVSVVAKSAMAADALATAIAVAWPDLSMLQPLKPAARIVTHTAEILTTPLQAMLDG
ncbi:thiamine biosynthesis protein ApbE [Sphingomonas spermidinifaciens]|uniref:FAD:protein FMN transferase n=1 Tax=Sphingomonas spermidinifaciens TaxID=1141889 RepID=A0A2A4BA43_9SPHN|nr:FAD:protein FMN transferase [Sphingomonas spermidinifaciens]PCD04678.1 thiamine biosynthesis protein ApbE [Sphingomonas spermidinifaciens]